MPLWACDSLAASVLVPQVEKLEDRPSELPQVYSVRTKVSCVQPPDTIL